MAEPNQPSFVSLEEPARAEIQSLVRRGDGFFHLAAQELPSAITGSLRPKWDSALAIVSGSAGSNGVVVLLGHRIDSKAGKMDHHPFAVAISSSVADSSGVFVNHLSSTSRSIDLPTGFATAFVNSNISNYYYDNPPFGVASGSLPQLPEPAREALGKVVTLLKTLSSGAAV